MLDQLEQKIFYPKFWQIKRATRLMSYQNSKLVVIAALSILLLGACTMAKLEARLEANPQCKDVVNAKTGAVMPCPGTDRAFYRSVGLEPAKVSAPSVAVTPAVAADSAASPQKEAPQAVTKTPTVSAPQQDCRPQIHKKSGGMIPCPPSD